MNDKKQKAQRLLEKILNCLGLVVVGETLRSEVVNIKAKKQMPFSGTMHVIYRNDETGEMTMNKGNAEVLIHYCEDKLIQNEHFKEYVLKNPYFILLQLNDELFENQLKREKKRIVHAALYQKRRTNELIMEFRRLHLPSDQIVGLKGFFLQDTYWPSNQIRFFGDIDLLASQSDCIPIRKHIVNCGYGVSGVPKCLIRFHSKKGYFRKYLHLSLERDGFLIELHSNLNHIHCGCGPSFNCDRMVEESIIKTNGDQSYRILSPIDNILFLMYHAIKHLSYVEQENAVLSINLQKFYDVAQVIDNEEIDWDLFVERTIEYKLSPYVVLFLRMFTDIFPDIIPQGVYEKVLQSVDSVDFLWKNIFCEVIKLNPADLILGDYSSVPLVFDAYTLAKSCSSNSKKRRIWKKCIENSLRRD
ncbi:MAG: nucleotidyltransferase family protein [Oscillospiraceae bacterium]|nr:nucleotidyltransferase family protein [Oscillospiraceae bacterium]